MNINKKQIGLLILVFLFILAGCTLPAVLESQPEAAVPVMDKAETSNLEQKAANPAGPSAALGDFSGEVQVMRPAGGNFQPAASGDVVYLNGQVQTGADGTARLNFADGTLVQVSPESLFTLMTIDEQDGGVFKKLSMQYGQVWVVLNGGSLEVETPVGAASVRGSYMMVEVIEGSDAITVTCLEGTCVLVVDGDEVVLHAGEKAEFSGSGIQSGFMTQAEIQSWLDNVEQAEEVLGEVPGSISDRVWEDLNGNGLQDSDEPGVPGVTVELLDAAGAAASATTDADGHYRFENIFAGNYSLAFSLDNTLFTVPDKGTDDDLDSDVNQGGLTAEFSLAPGEHRTDLDAGLVYPGHAGLCPLTGLPTDAGLLDNRPIFVSISKFPAWATRPAALAAAPVVFETIIDEGQTRLQALYYCGYPEKLPENSASSGAGKLDISGVRSGRVFYAELAELFGAGLIFGGADAQVYKTIAPYQCGVVDNVNIPGNIGALGLDIESLESVAENCQHRLGNTDLNVWQFGASPAGGQPAGKFLMHYNYLNQTRWEYDPQAGGYVRYENDPESPEEFTLSTDKLSGGAIVRQNIILLETPHAVLNSSGTIIDFDLTDERGYAWLLRDGTMYEACWSAVFNDYATSSNRYRPFLLYNCTTKEPINFAYGSTWVNVVAPSFWFETSGEYLVAKQPFLGYGE